MKNKKEESKIEVKHTSDIATTIAHLTPTDYEISSDLTQDMLKHKIEEFLKTTHPDSRNDDFMDPLIDAYTELSYLQLESQRVNHVNTIKQLSGFVGRERGIMEQINNYVEGIAYEKAK